MKKRITFLLTILISVIILVSLVKTIYKTFQSGKRLSILGVEVESLDKEKESLEKVLVERKSEDFVEKEAREKLNLVKPGETLVVIPESQQSTISSQQSAQEELSQFSNPQQWWYLFFGKY